MARHGRKPSRRLGVGALISTIGCITGLTVNLSPAHAAPDPVPPFTQCPAVGQSASCKVLLVIEPDQSVSVYDDPSVGDYDGGDDTLVGIVNNSNAYVPAVTVTGAGSDLGGFDGDGLCVYVACNWPAPTGYEGPGTSFTVDPSDFDSAEVDFGTAGLGPGQSTYFSLEGTLTAATLTARKGGLGSYAAMGDSYSAGEMGDAGTYGYNSQLPNNHCHRSPNAYGPLLDAAKSLGQLNFIACSGAITDDLFRPNHANNIDVNTGTAEAPQLDGLHADTKTVTITIGGNDIGFAEVLRQCLIGRIGTKRIYGDNPGGCSTNPNITGPVYARLRALEGTGTATAPGGQPIHTLLSVLEAVHQRAPSARVFIASYPELFGKFSGECGVGTIYASNVPVVGYGSAAVKILSKDAVWLDKVADLMNQVVNDSIALAGREQITATPVNPSPQFSKHRLCDSATAWIKGVNGTYDYKTKIAKIDGGSFHPTVDGQAAYLAAFETAVV